MQIPYQRRIAPDNHFFDEGNQECIQCLHTVQEDIDFVIEKIDSLQVEEFTCYIKGCRETFKNPLQYNRHYDMVHRYRCQHCNRNFPSNFLLGLHVQENHDSYFKAQSEKSVSVYRCLLESCAKKFVSAEERLEHLVDRHKYPADFRFNTTKRKHLKYQDSKKKNECGGKSSGENIIGVVTETISMDVASGDIDIDDVENGGKSSVDMDIPSEFSDITHVKEETAAMQENVQNLNKKGNSNDTKLGSSGGQNRRERKINKKDKSDGNTSGTVSEDMETDGDVKDSETKKEKKRNIPKNITFGRGAHRGFSRTKYK